MKALHNHMPHSKPTSKNGYLLDREELLRVRMLKLLTSDRDYVFFALQIDYPGKLNPQVLNATRFLAVGKG